MSKVNIPNNYITQNDVTYRYKRDCLILKKSGQYELLDNLDLIIKQLKVPKQQFLQYIPKYLAQPFRIISNKIAIKSKTIIELENMIETFIIDYVICPECMLPELNLEPNTDNFNICDACGYNKTSINNIVISKTIDTESENMSKISKTEKKMSKAEKKHQKNIKKTIKFNKCTDSDNFDNFDNSDNFDNFDNFDNSDNSDVN